MANRTALVAGGSGLVGGFLLDRLLKDNGYSRVVSLGRRLLPREHPKLLQREVDFAALERLKPFPPADDVFCCLGTTIAKAGSQEAFRAVDHDAVLALAKTSKQVGASQFLLCWRCASAKSRVFYNRVKGEAEDAVAALGYPAFIVLRPSILDGPRAESRPGERVGLAVARVLAPVLGKYGPTHADDVAAAMISEAHRRPQGRVDVEALQIRELARARREAPMTATPAR